jgi:nucleotide-binding universal stress UspA family protein
MTSIKTMLVPLDGSAQATAAMPVARGLAELLHATVAVLHVTDDALAGAALVERMKLSCEDARGLVIERHPGAAAAVDQQSGGALPADVRDYPDAIAQAVSQLRLVGVNGPYSVSLSPANEPEPPLICAARNLKNSDDGQSAC